MGHQTPRKSQNYMLGRFLFWDTLLKNIHMYRNDEKKSLLNPVGMEKKLRKTWSWKML